MMFIKGELLKACETRSRRGKLVHEFGGRCNLYKRDEKVNIDWNRNNARLPAKVP